MFEARRTLLTQGGAGAYTRAASVFLYPDWWINENIGLLEERERGGPELSAGRDRRKPH